MVELHSTAMVHTKQTKHKYCTKEEEEMAERRMEEEAEESQEAGTDEESQETGMAEKSQDEPAKKKRKKDKKSKDKKPKLGVKSMMKEERQKKFEELKAERKAKAPEKKKAKEEAEKEKARLEKNIKCCLRKHILLQRNIPAAAARSATATATCAEIHPAPPRTEPTENPLETSLVESGPLLVSLNPFEGDEPIIRPTLEAHPGAAVILTETIHVESSTERPLEAAGGVPKKSTGGKAP